MMEVLKKESIEVALIKSIITAILKKNREISYSEVKALPFIETEEDVDRIISLLKDEFDLEEIYRKISSSPIISWDKVFRIKKTNAG